VKTNSVLPITDTGSGAGKINTSDFAPALNTEYTYNGKLYAVPANYATLSLYYNKKMFAAAGIASPPTTVAEFQADAKKLTVPSKKQYGLVLADNQTIQMWPILQWLGGGDIVGANNCSVVQTSADQAALKPWVDLVKNDKISPVGLTGAEADSTFSAGKAAMELNGPWAAPGYKSAGIDLGVATVPVGTDGKATTLGSTVGLAISAKTKYPQQAQEFLAYYTSKAEQKKFSLTTGFPTIRTDLASDPDLQANEIISTFTKQIPDARLYLPKVPQATQVDANGYVPMIGKLTRGADLASTTAATAKTIDALTGCSS
jgi:multiple sugar transport system substrate-binding protein